VGVIKTMRDIMSAAPVCMAPGDDLDEARRLVLEYAVRRIPVLADGVPVGVVSVGDLALEADPAPGAWSAPF